MTPLPVSALVLAAGAGRRFGSAKQLAAIDGRPLLERVLAEVTAPAEPRVASGAPLAEVVVALGAHADAVLAAVDLHGARPLRVAGWEEGQAASLRAGVAAVAPSSAAVLILLGDQPDVGADAIGRVLSAWEAQAPRPVRAVHRGRPGHPVLLPRALFPAVADLRGDAGARALLAGAIEVECGPEVVRDVDRPADL